MCDFRGDGAHVGDSLVRQSHGDGCRLVYWFPGQVSLWVPAPESRHRVHQSGHRAKTTVCHCCSGPQAQLLSSPASLSVPMHLKEQGRSKWPVPQSCKKYFP